MQQRGGHRVPDQQAEDGEFKVEPDSHCLGCEFSINGYERLLSPDAQGLVEEMAARSAALNTVVNVLGGLDATVLAAPMALEGVGAAVHGLAQLAGSYYATMPGATAVVLGAYRSVYNPSYLNAAKGWVNALDIPRGMYSFLNFFGEGWTANQQFLNNVVAAGQQIYLSEGPLGNAGLYEGYASELAYLESIAVGPTQWWMLVH